MQTKSCTNPNCEQVNPQPVTEFYLNRGYKDGYNSHCKSCWRRYLEVNRDKRRQQSADYNNTHKQQRKEYHEANKERISERMKATQEARRETKKKYYQANKEKLSEQSRSYYKANSERQKENMRRWQKENPERVRARRRELYGERPEAILAKSHKRRAHVAGNGGSYTIKEWQALCDYYGNKCLACGKPKKLAVDHVIPIAKGGANDISNLQPLCKSCNSSKGTKIIDYRPNLPPS